MDFGTIIGLGSGLILIIATMLLGAGNPSVFINIPSILDGILAKSTKEIASTYKNQLVRCKDKLSGKKYIIY